MFAPANAPQFTLVIPTVRNDFKVLAFEGTETISALYSEPEMAAIHARKHSRAS
ncbi:hypothetical protein H8F22_17415 [Pseudomonas sp. P154a]|jgi:hypothetical protein|uniref:hypothetical protein n=1 Tax=Pseudomonas TaxID=286 RepID=UPI0007226EC2|nr:MULTISPECIES: hypothetical protein [Pseudomonas]MBF6040656.1 hypothetical protein [Pseudomonas mucoides]CRL49771.1 hypothetical protein PSHI_28820 [Pseudomonas sp. URMO17WK12:I11]